MTSHFWLMVLFSVFVSLVFALLMRDEPKEQLRFGGLLFAGFVATAVILGWLMYPLPL
jgi:heme/copper-type cytochrome/quinol oxidase subunit 4